MTEFVNGKIDNPYPGLQQYVKFTRSDEEREAERAYGIELTDYEVMLLTAQAGLLDPIQKQEKYLLQMALHPVECPGCHGVICQRAAMPDYTSKLRTPGAVGDSGYECPLCTARLEYRLGLVGEQWFSLSPGQTIRVPEVAPKVGD